MRLIQNQKFNMEHWKVFIESAPLIIEDNADGSQFVPIGIVETDLTELDTHWGTENFKFRVFQMGEYWYISSSVELAINYGGLKRKLVGASTVRVDQQNPIIDNAESISLSESTKSAAKKIGKRFGSELNGRMDAIRFFEPSTNTARNNQKKSAVLMKPDEKIIQQWQQAHAKNDIQKIKFLESMYDLSNELPF
jgi:hypothetical protein